MSEPLDMPDGPGWWAFEGYINYPCGAIAEREVVRVFWGKTTNAWQVVREKGRHPAKMLVGKWYRLTMPWEPQTPTIPPDVRETLRGALLIVDQSGINKKRILAALSWLDAQQGGRNG